MPKSLSITDSFQLQQPKNIDVALRGQPMLDPCLSWLVTSGQRGLSRWVPGVENASLKEAVLNLLLKMPSLDPIYVKSYRLAGSIPLSGGLGLLLAFWNNYLFCDLNLKLKLN